MAIDYTKEEILNPGSKTYSENPFFLKPGESQADYLARTNQPAPYVPGSSTTSATGKDVFGNPVAAGTPIVSPTISTAVGNGITRTTSLDEFKAQREAEKKALAEEARIQRQAIIDAINTRYGAKSQRVQEEGNQALASQRSINLRSGLGGSDFGSAAKADVRVKTSKALDVVEAEKQQELSSAIAAIEQLTLNKQEAARQGRLDEETFVKDLRAGYEKTLASLKKAGTTIDKLRNTEVYQDYLDAGLTDIEIDAALKPDQEDYIYSVLSDGRVARYKKSGGEPEFFAAPANLNPNAEITAYKDGIYQQTPEVDADGNITGWKLEKLRGFAETGGGAGSMTTTQAWDRERAIKTDFEKAIKDSKVAVTNAKIVDVAFQDLKSNFKEGKSLNVQSQAVILGLNKIIDSTSVVRSEEYDRTARGQSLYDMLDGKVQQLKAGGTGASMNTLEEIRDISKEILKIHLDGQMEYAQLAKFQADKLQEESAGEYGSLDRILTPSMKKNLDKYMSDDEDTSGTVDVISPDGTPGTIPTSQLEEALQAGYKKA